MLFEKTNFDFRTLSLFLMIFKKVVKAIMNLQKDSLKIVEDDGDNRYVVNFKFLLVLLPGNLKLPVKFIEPIFLSGDYWDIEFCYSNENSYCKYHGWSMELIHSDLTKTFKVTWSVTLLGLDAKDNVTCSHSGKILFPSIYQISIE